MDLASRQTLLNENRQMEVNSIYAIHSNKQVENKKLRTSGFHILQKGEHATRKIVRIDIFIDKTKHQGS